MKRLAAVFIILIICAVGSAIGLVVIHASHHATAAVTPTPRPAMTPTPNPLSITAIRNHPVTASPVTTVQTLAPRGGCATSVISFTVDDLNEHALLQIPPTTKPASGYPVVILAHGYIAPASYQTTGSDYQGFINTFCAQPSQTARYERVPECRPSRTVFILPLLIGSRIKSLSVKLLA